MNNKVTILKDLSAGSNATTILCMDDKSTFYRKYAFGADAVSLKRQVDFICSYRKKLKMPMIFRSDYVEDGYMYYDMPEVKGAVNLFDYVHIVEIKKSEKLLVTIFEDMDKNIYCIKDNINNDFNKYINEKVIKNIDGLYNSKFINELLKYKTLIINGKEYKNLTSYKWLYDKEYIKKVIEKDEPSIMHGDFTIENIIAVNSDKENDYYIIDPNLYVDYQTKYLDYAKLMQSLHGKYEFLMRTYNFDVVDNEISYFMSHSKVYDDLHTFLDEYISNKFGFDGSRSIYLHEIIHWLRLMPYKINKDEGRAVIFFAELIVLLNEYNDRFYK